jgi:hypothetical protein
MNQTSALLLSCRLQNEKAPDKPGECGLALGWVSKANENESWFYSIVKRAADHGQRETRQLIKKLKSCCA